MNGKSKRFPHIASGATYLKLKKAAVCFAVVGALTASFGAMSSQLCYAVSVNGQYVGTVAEKSYVVKLMGDMDDSLKVSADDTVSIEDQVSIAASFDFGNLPIQTLKNNIIKNLSGVKECWYLSVDGQTLARAGSREEISEMLDSILSCYESDNTTRSDFKQNVIVAYGLVSENVETDLETVKSSLMPDSGSEASLDVMTVTADYEYTQLPYETVQEESDLYYPEDSGAVLMEGQDGILETKVETIWINGAASSQSVTSRTVKEPISQVVAIGTKEYVYESSGHYIWPATGHITSNFGYRNVSIGSSNHQGIDIAGSYFQDIKAADAGTVIYSGWMSGYGNLLQIRHDNGDVTYYAHCTQLNVSVGEKVYQGQVVAQMGNTGVSSGVHLHFEVRPGGGSPRDPIDYLP